MNRQHRALLIRLQVGGCTCETKTDEVKYHSTDCQYRVACEIEEALTFEDDTIPAAQAHCQCSACKDGAIHASDCAVHNAPALPVGECDCGAAAPAQSAEPVTLEQVKALEVAVCHGQSGEALRLLHHMRNALAAPQPSQTAVVLDDERAAFEVWCPWSGESMRKVAWEGVQYWITFARAKYARSAGKMLTSDQLKHLAEAARSLERSTDGYDSVLACTIREILTIAQPVEQTTDCDARIRKWRDSFDTMHARAMRAEEKSATVDDLAMLVKKLVRHVRKASPGNNMAEMALDYLRRHGLEGSPLRTVAQPVEQTRALTDEEILALNTGEVFFSETPSKYPEAGHGTQYHCGAPGLLKFARALLTAARPASGDANPAAEAERG